MKFPFIFIAILLPFLFVNSLDAIAAAEAAVDNKLHYHKDDKGFVLVLRPGQKVIESLTAFMEKEKLPGATFSAIGSVKNAELACYDVKSKGFTTKTFEDPQEVVSLNGSLGYFDQKPITHAHIAFAGPDFIVHGGHLREADVSLFLEVFITPTGDRIIRQESSEFPGAKVINVDAK